MQRMSRRDFTRRLTAAPLLPLAISGPDAGQSEPSRGLPATIAGYTPNNDERAAALRFLAKQEESLVPLRHAALPNDLPPAPVFHPAGGAAWFDAVLPRRRTGTPGSGGSGER